ESLFNEGLRGVSLISFAPADGFEVGLWFGIGLVNSHGRLRDGVVFAFVHCHRALARRGIGVPIIGGRRCLLIVGRRRKCVGRIGGVAGGRASVVICSGVRVGAHVRAVGTGGEGCVAIQRQLRFQVAQVLQLGKGRQFVQALQPEVVQEALGGAK